MQSAEPLPENHRSEEEETMKLDLIFALLGAIIILLILFPIFSRTLTELNSTSTDGNSTLPINPWSLVTTYFTTPIFLWLIPLFVVAFVVLKMTKGDFSDDEPSYSSEDRPYPSYIETEEGEEDIGQIRPTGDLQDLRCPKCSAPLSFREKRDLTKCRYCGSQVQRRIEEEE